MVDKGTTMTTTTILQQPQQPQQTTPKPTYWQALRQFIRQLNDIGCHVEPSSSKGFVIYYADNKVLAGGYDQTWVAVVRWMKQHHIYDIPDTRKHKENTVHDVWAGLPLVSGVVLRPDISEPMVPDGHNGWLRNLWIPYQYSTPPQAHQRVELVQPYLTVVEFLVPNPLERKIVMQYYAHALRPDTAADKPSFALLFTGPEGDGKSFAFDTVPTLVLGKERVHHAQQGVNALATALETAGYHDKALCICDDFDDANTKTVERLKCVITRLTAQIRRLYQDAMQVPIYTRHIFIGNSHNPIYFGSGTDRRYFAPAYCPDKDPAIIALIDDYHHNKLRKDPVYRDAWYWYMTTQVDISDFNPHVLVETDNHRRMLANCVTDVQSQFQAMLDELKPDLVTKYWYQHHLIKMFGDDVTDATVNKHWRAISGYLRDGAGWQHLQFRVPGSGSRGKRLWGFVRPGVTDAQVKAMLAALDPADLEVYTLSSLGDKGWYAS